MNNTRLVTSKPVALRKLGMVLVGTWLGAVVERLVAAPDGPAVASPATLQANRWVEVDV